MTRAHDQFKATLGEADQEFRAIMNIEQEIIRLIEANNLSREVLNNPYCELNGAEVHRKWGEVQQLVPKRDSQLQQELMRQQCNYFVILNSLTHRCPCPFKFKT